MEKKDVGQISFSSSDENEDEQAEAMESANRLTKELRSETACRKPFASFVREEFDEAARMFVYAGYYAIEDIRLVQENARQFFITDL